jgi:hypothetical protein
MYGVTVHVHVRDRALNLVQIVVSFFEIYGIEIHKVEFL